MPAKIFRDRRLTDVDAWLLQFAVDPPRTAEGIRGRRLADQGPHIWRRTGASGSND